MHGPVSIQVRILGRVDESRMKRARTVRGARGRRARCCGLIGVLAASRTLTSPITYGLPPTVPSVRVGVEEKSSATITARPRDSQFYLQNGLLYRAVAVPRDTLPPSLPRAS